MRQYHIIDNGGVSFIVNINGAIATVFTPLKFGNDIVADKQIMNIKFKKVYPGLNPMNFFSTEWNPELKGNSLLVQVSARKFIFIGTEIFLFDIAPKDSIVKFISFMGPNGVPYPYAIGKKYTYLMLGECKQGKCEYVYLDNRFLDLKKDIYAQYYGHDNINRHQHKYILKTLKMMKIKKLVNRPRMPVWNTS